MFPRRYSVFNMCRYVCNSRLCSLRKVPSLMEIKCPDLNECDLLQCSAFKLINKVGNLHHCSCTHPHTTCTIAAIAYGLISYRKRTCYKWHEVCHIRQRPWSEYMLRITIILSKIYSPQEALQYVFDINMLIFCQNFYYMNESRARALNTWTWPNFF